MGWLSILILGAAVLAAASVIAAGLLTGVMALPTSPRVLGQVLSLVERQPRRQIVDLGSGYGTLVLAAARRCPRAVVLGYEVSPVPYLVSKLRLALAGLPNAQIRFGNYFDADLSTADLVLCYLARRPMRRLREKLESELPLGAEVVGHTFSIPGWTPVQTLTAPDLYHTPVYRYLRPQPLRAALRHPWMERPLRNGVKAAGMLEAPPPETSSES
jgi:SAM-dependent methyltransferase